MTEHSNEAAETGPRHATVEAAVAVAIGLFGMITIAGSLQVGINWGAEGPKAGFFPFYVGLMIVASSVVNLLHSWNGGSHDRLFASWDGLRKVLSVVLPTAVYVALVPTIGIYISSMLLIALFMKWLGRYGWPLVAAISVGVPVAFYLMFEKWFLVPLPKGPIEYALGL